MTSIMLTVAGAQAWASVTGPLTSGMVGIPVTIEYDEAWEGLTKNLVCRCSQWGSDSGETRAILNVGKTAAVAHEVMQAERYLYLGIEGFSDDGRLVIPTTWAMCGKIQYGANTGEDPSADPELTVWNQLQTEIEEIKQDAITQEQVSDIQACAQSAAQAASNAARSEENAGISASSAAYLVNAAVQAQSAAETAAGRAEAAADSLQNGAGGISNVAARLLTTILRSCSTYAPQTANIDALEAALSQEEAPAEGVTRSGSVLTIISGVTVTQDGSALTIV